MSAEIEKLAVFDPRIIQNRPKYAVNKGALSVTNAPFNAISASPSQMTFNIYVPSENVFVDRAIDWSADIFLQTTVTKAAGVANIAVGEPVAILGQDIAVCPFPLNSLCATATATLNDAVAAINSQDVLQPILRMKDYAPNRTIATTPTRLDTYLAYQSGSGAINNTLAGYNSAAQPDFVGNGAFAGVVFTTPTGAPLGAGLNGSDNTDATPAYVGATYAQINGVPVGGSFDGAEVAGPWTLYLRIRSTEPICLSPFIFAEAHENEVGLFGINNVQVITNFQSPARLLRNDPTKKVISGTTFQATPFDRAVMNVQFLTPSLDVELPPKSVVPYMEFPRYISQPGALIQPGKTDQVVSQTITLPQIPDFMLVYVRGLKADGAPATEDPASPQFADGYLACATSLDNVRSPLSVQFDNFAGLLSTYTAEELYAASVLNGLNVDWNQFSGSAWCGGNSYATPPAGKLGLTGAPLVLRFGKDIALQAGQAPSLVGNFTLQLNLSVKNNYAFPVKPVMYIITANSGFFESIRGSSRIIKGVLSEQDIISAPMAGSHADMSRLVGSGFFSKLGNALSKAKDIYHATKPMVSALKEHLPAEGRMGQVKSALGAVGYGAVGAGAVGAGRRKTLSERLM